MCENNLVITCACIFSTVRSWELGVWSVGYVYLLSQTQIREIDMDQRRVEILRICLYGRRRGATPTIFFWLQHKEQLIRDRFFRLTNSWSLDHCVSKRSWIYTGFHGNSYYVIRVLQHFKAHWAIFDPSPQNSLCCTNLSCLVFEIFRFYGGGGGKHAQKYFGSFCLTVYVDTSRPLSF
jgi:hypothetical protein